MQGSYIRVGDADKPMTEYEIYSYEAFRKKYRDDIRAIEDVSFRSLDTAKVDAYLALKHCERPNLAVLPDEQQYELTGVMRNGKITITALLLFGLYPQAFYPQLSIIATSVPGKEMGALDSNGNRFLDSKRIEGTLPDMLDGAIAFVRTNMRTATKIDPKTGERMDVTQYPITAVREAVLNALVHRDYSFHTEGMPIQLVMYSDRMEITNPGGLYGRLTVDQLGQAQPDTRNPVLVTAMETLGKTENRYSGIPTIRYARNIPFRHRCLWIRAERSRSFCLTRLKNKLCHRQSIDVKQPFRMKKDSLNSAVHRAVDRRLSTILPLHPSNMLSDVIWIRWCMPGRFA